MEVERCARPISWAGFGSGRLNLKCKKVHRLLNSPGEVEKCVNLSSDVGSLVDSLENREMAESRSGPVNRTAQAS